MCKDWFACFLFRYSWFKIRHLTKGKLTSGTWCKKELELKLTPYEEIYLRFSGATSKFFFVQLVSNFKIVRHLEFAAVWCCLHLYYIFFARFTWDIAVSSQFWWHLIYIQIRFDINSEANFLSAVESRIFTFRR